MKTERRTAYAALRRGMAFLCTLVLTLMAVTLPAEAVGGSGLTVQNIGLSEDVCQPGTKPSFDEIKEIPVERTSSWDANGTEITGTVNPAMYYGKYRALPRYQSEAGAHSTLTITNTGGEACLLTFSYAPPSNGGTLSFSPEGVASDGTCRAILAHNESVTVTLTSKQETKRERDSKNINDTTIATLSHIEWTSMNANIEVTLATPTNGGIYTAIANNGEELRVGEPHNMPRNTEYTFTAIPDPEYNFVGWYVDGQRRSEDLTFRTRFTDSCTVEAKFVSKDAALFETGGKPFNDLNEAVAYAQANNKDTITLESNGKITGHYMIPAGITLLIPFDEAKTLYTNEPGYVNKAEAQKAYRILTMAPSSSITVDGAISVGGKHFAGSSGSCCKATGQYGQIIMQEGSGITLNNGANLYAWGYITGDGKITAARGATVYEYFQVADWRGGVAVSKLINNKEKVFPFSQYYVQNIEAALTIQAGAQEHAYFSVDAAIVGTNSVTIDFIGSNTSLFRIYDGGELTKKYDPKTDRITYTTKGSASLDSLALKVSSYNMNSRDYVLPVNNNMTLEILSGRVEVNSDAALLPGAQITIAQGAELSVSTNTSLYVYDRGQWEAPYVYGSKESGFVPIPYTPTTKGSRTLANAKIDVNGTLTAAGSIYTTNSGADICSSEGTGKFVQQSVPGTAAVTHQVSKQENKKNWLGIPYAEITYANIPITAAQLHNLDNSYTETAKANAGDTFTYCTGSECGGGTWVQNLKVAAIIDGNGAQADTYATLQAAVDTYSPDNNTAPKNYIKLLHSTTEEITADRNLYLDLNGCTVTGNFKMGNNTLYGMDSSAGTGYVTAPRGKIVGGVSYYAKTYETPPTVDGEYDRYVAILGAENGTPTLSFHHFNISVTGYRFELAAPQCALIFCGKFQGDKAAKDYLKSLGFTLTGDNSTESKNKMSDALNKEFVKEEGDAYLFELYLIRSFEKNSSDKTAYTEEFSATARATFKNGGTQDSGPQDSETKDSKTQHLSFQKAWQNALDPNSGMKPEDKEILQKFLDAFGITI